MGIERDVLGGCIRIPSGRGWSYGERSGLLTQRGQRGGEGVQSETNVHSVGLLIKGMSGTPPETGVAGTK